MKNKANGKRWIKWSEMVSGVARIVAMVALALLGLPKAAAQNIQPIYSFPQGPAIPFAALVAGPDGNFYGTTVSGGRGGEGTVIKVTTNGVMTLLYSFSPPAANEGTFLTNSDGAQPMSALALGPDGNFYGTTFYGGSNNAGTVFAITTNGTLTTLVSFAFTNGAGPEGSLILGTNGNFYGTTLEGGSNDYGTIFEITTNGVLTTLHAFTNGTDGANPYAGLTLGTNGNFYGTCGYGGVNQWGTVFEVTPNGGFTALYSFTDGSDGADPDAALTPGPNGNFYGTTSGDDDSTHGSVFEMTPKGVLTALHSFTGGNDGGSPDAALALGPDGNFYGTTDGAGSNPWGTVFEVRSNGAFATLASFASTNGMYPRGNLILGSDGNFYGTTSYGGAEGIGELYRLDLPPEIIQQPASQSAATGAPVTLSVTLFGTAPYSFQWLSNNIPMVGTTNGTLTITNFAAGDAANYSVVVTNAWGRTTSAVASLTVAAVPVISSATLSDNGNVILNCQGPTNGVSRLWATTNLAVPTDWTPIFTNSVTSASGAWQYTDTNGPCQQRFYRLSMP